MPCATKRFQPAETYRDSERKEGYLAHINAALVAFVTKWLAASFLAQNEGFFLEENISNLNWTHVFLRLIL